MLSRRVHCEGKEVQISLQGVSIEARVSVQEVLHPSMNLVDSVERIILVRKLLNLSGIIGLADQMKLFIHIIDFNTVQVRI